MKRRGYIFILGLATTAVLLSTLVMHHHHKARLCFVEERCAEDGHVNDEHTSHQENESDCCVVSQIHHFLVQVKTVNGFHKQLADGMQALVALCASQTQLTAPSFQLLTIRWQAFACPLPAEEEGDISRRGPPVFSFS